MKAIEGSPGKSGELGKRGNVLHAVDLEKGGSDVEVAGRNFLKYGRW